ncbi:MAG: hypothetical protein Q8L34_03070 [Candidatus Woesearchaeota archaeon]|nr:hypothetical protein [Candidatus Woesearchaeota archaeon]
MNWSRYNYKKAFQFAVREMEVEYMQCPNCSSQFNEGGATERHKEWSKAQQHQEQNKEMIKEQEVIPRFLSLIAQGKTEHLAKLYETMEEAGYFNSTIVH